MRKIPVSIQTMMEMLEVYTDSSKLRGHRIVSDERMYQVGHYDYVKIPDHALVNKKAFIDWYIATISGIVADNARMQGRNNLRSRFKEMMDREE